MDFEQARQDILTWVENFVEQPNPALAGWPPCPFARRARVNNLLDIRPGRVDPYVDLKDANMDQFDVIAYVYDPADHVGAEFDHMIHAVNQAFLVPRNLIALADHPDCPEIVNGVSMNQGRWAIAFLQDLDKLNAHADQLAERGFYHAWPADYLENLFAHRKDPTA